MIGKNEYIYILLLELLQLSDNPSYHLGEDQQLFS